MPFDIGDAPALAARIGEVDTVVSEHGVDLVGDRFDKNWRQLPNGQIEFTMRQLPTAD
jgi:hypothetical protein